MYTVLVLSSYTLTLNSVHLHQTNQLVSQAQERHFDWGGGTVETTHRVVSNLYNNLWKLEGGEGGGGHMPPVPPPGSYAYGLFILTSSITFSVLLELYRRGAAIVVDTFYVPDVYSQLLFNPLCFLLYNESRSPEHWENVSITSMQ